ncbi:V-type ATP synthase subunit C [uncultured Finegoldia sp.]|uniref:V-type ATP synthase subunit C n=1 Tax=uncultured Finegoldia sp. TaxID=328009 RepID=UPI002625A354|nr:V-type ATP synthase subunit C [uncultured Finegoldia sp.]
MKKEDFIHQSAITRVKEKELLTRNDYERLIDATNLDETVRLLSDTVYQSEFAMLDKYEHYDQALKNELKKTYKYMYDMSDFQYPVDLMALKYDYHNLKVLIKEYLKKEDFSHMLSEITRIEYKSIRDSLRENTETEFEHYDKVIRQSINDFEENKDPQMIDIFADREYFEETSEIAEKIDSKLINEYVEDLIDFTNIKTLLRVQNQKKNLEFLKKVIISGGSIESEKFEAHLHSEITEDSSLFKQARIYYSVKDAISEYKKSNSLSAFEKAMDDYLMEKVKEIKKVTYGAEVLFGYLFAKETEIKNLRIIFVGKINSLKPDYIRSKLRLSYA